MNMVKKQTEADIEAKIHSTIRKVFPFLPSDSLRHQISFPIQLGKKTLKSSRTGARLDVLVTYNDVNLAVLELKKTGLPLDEEDRKQGISYASLVRPIAPLVVLTNGENVEFIDTFTGTEWKPEGASEQSIKDLFESASKAAIGDLKNAIGTLIGTKLEIWQQAVRETAKDTIKALTGGWNDHKKPFVSDYSIPRQATKTVLNELTKGSKLVLVEGLPLIGKSNILRELTKKTEDSEEFVVLYVEGYSGIGLFRQLSYMLTGSLNWPVSPEEVRNWLVDISKLEQPTLVLAVDGVTDDNNVVKGEIEELISSVFGNGIRVVLGVDESVADSLVMKGRQETPIGRQAKRVLLEALNDDELQEVKEYLCQRRVHFYPGYLDCIEYRQPWILRSVLANVFSRIDYETNNVRATLPPLLGISLIGTARERFQGFEKLNLFQSIAKAILDDTLENSIPIELMLQSATSFIVRKTQLKQYLDYQEIKELLEQGYLRARPPISGEDIFIVGLPELLASELSIVLSQRLTGKDSSDIAYQLSKITTLIPFGDIIGACALIDLLEEQGELESTLLWCLLDIAPEKQELKPGSKITGVIDGIKHDFKVLENNVVEVSVKGQSRTIKLPEATNTISSNGWLVLSQLCSMPASASDEQGKNQFRLDEELMLAVGTCPIPLVRPNVHLNQYHTIENLEIGETYLSHSVGIIEPVTASILNMLFFAGRNARNWLERAVSTQSQALLWRVAIALRSLQIHADEDKSNFAKEAYRDFIQPYLKLPPRSQTGERQKNNKVSQDYSAIERLQKASLLRHHSKIRLAGTLNLIDCIEQKKRPENSASKKKREKKSRV